MINRKINKKQWKLWIMSGTHLFVELVVGHQVDVLHTRGVGDGDGGTAGFQLDHGVSAVVGLDNGEVQCQIAHITLVGLQTTQLPVRRIEKEKRG